jgi:hypothetical protein
MAFQAGTTLLNTSAVGKDGSGGMVRVLSAVATEDPENLLSQADRHPPQLLGCRRRSRRRRQLHVVVASTD